MNEPTLVVQLALICLGMNLFIATFLFWFEILILIYECIVPPLKPENKNQIHRYKSLLIVGLTILLTVLSVTNNSPVIEEVEVNLPELPKIADGFTIVQISDLHLGPTAGLTYLSEIVQQVNALKPDIIVITGNIADFSYSLYYEPLAAEIDKLKSKSGVYFCTGISDFWSGASETWARLLHYKGINVLRNSVARIADGNNETIISIVGVDDWYSGYFYSMWGVNPGPKLKDTLGLVSDTTRPIILLANNPSQFYQSYQQKIDLQLSGHNLGGQVFPMHFWIYPFHTYFAGKYETDSSVLYVSRGLGYWLVPLRLGSKPEISKIVLRSRQGHYEALKEEL